MVISESPTSKPSSLPIRINSNSPTAEDSVQRWSVGDSTLALPPGYTALNSEGVYGHLRNELPRLSPNIFVFLVWGILGRAWGELEHYYFDPIDVDTLAEAILSTPEGSTVVLWFRSPGGTVGGIPETAEAIRDAGKTRRLLAFTDDVCASAAYWLAAECETITAAPTAELGSIGVYIALYDWCEYLQKAGIKLELFKAGEMKAMGLIGSTLSEKERSHLEDRVQGSYVAFTRNVLRNRLIAPEFMQGQTLNGEAASAANLCDAFSLRASTYFQSFR